MEPSDLRFFDRELSWLSFNARVLQEAADDRVPLIERLRFLAIFSSNLDEFFRVRVAALRTLVRMSPKRTEKLHFNPRRLLLEIHQKVDRQQRHFGQIFRDLLSRLRTEGIHLHEAGTYPPEASHFLRRYFIEKVAPHIHPIILEHYVEPPFLKNGGLYLVVPLWPREELDVMVANEPRHGIVEVPTEHMSRFVQVHRDKTHRHVMFLDDIIRSNLGQIFSLHDIGEAYAIKMTRDAQLYIEDEYSGDLVDMIRKSLSQRDTGAPTRFLYDQRLPYTIATKLKRRLELEEEDMVAGGYYHNFSDFFRFPDFDRRDLLFRPMPPLLHESLQGADSVLQKIREKDVLLHFPYQSFDPVLDFIRDAARDPDVLRLSATLYRVAPDSGVVSELIRAAESGKSVKAFAEIKARFDEQPNLSWAQRMEAAGADVVYSHPGLKVHCKLVLAETATTSYAYLGTGNLNEKTARVYCDHGMLTADDRITEDVRRVFELLDDPSAAIEFEHLLVAPRTMRARFKALVEREIRHATAGREARMVLKMNSLEDRGMIRLLYRAGQSGVDVRLIVRGICCLVPGVPGLSDRIRVTSIVGRFLEHARIYLFHNDGDEDIYLASADWMKRNLKRRIEVAWPIYDLNLKRQMLDVLQLQQSDNVRARVIDEHQQNDYVRRVGEETVDAQLDTYRYLSGKAAERMPDGPSEAVIADPDTP